METKHTPGSWERNIAPARKYNTIFAGRNTHVAHLSTTGLSDEEIEANANLIAAAPDLLEALQALMPLAHDRQETDAGVARYEAARAAIKKATGSAS